MSKMDTLVEKARVAFRERYADRYIPDELWKRIGISCGLHGDICQVSVYLFPEGVPSPQDGDLDCSRVAKVILTINVTKEGIITFVEEPDLPW